MNFFFSRCQLINFYFSDYFSQEQLAEALKKKKECNVKAKNIVEKLLDPVEDPKELPVLLRDINQSHYQDIVEERAITHVCGYPLCNEKLVE